MPWAVIEDLEAHIGRSDDGRMEDDLAAALAYCNRQRPDLDPEDAAPADVKKAVLIYAALLWRERTTPSGFSTYEEYPDAAMGASSAMVNVYRLLGTRKPTYR